MTLECKDYIKYLRLEFQVLVRKPFVEMALRTGWLVLNC